MEIFILILLCISILSPVYAYAIYPIILKFLPSEKKYLNNENYAPFVSVLVRDNKDDLNTRIKLENLSKQSYPPNKYEIIIISKK